MIANACKKVVVDRAGFGYSLPVNGFWLANQFARLSEVRALPKSMANRNRAGMRRQPHPALTTNERMRFDMADADLGRADRAGNRADRQKQINAECDALFAAYYGGKAAWSRPALVPPPALCGSIYFIAPADRCSIKIGFSRRVAFRLRGLQLANAQPLELLAAVEGPATLEREYHKRFAAHRLHGEWFAPHPDILAEIDRLQAAQEPGP